MLSGCFKYVGGADVSLYPVETVCRVELGPLSVTIIPVTGSIRVLDTGAGFSGL